MAEKRESKRHRKRLYLKFGADGPSRIAFTDDISPEGLFIKTTDLLLPGSRINIDLILKDDSSVTLEGRVMWVKRVPRTLLRVARKGGMGVLITRIVQGADTYTRLCGGLARR
jgi:hypothetical protein